MTERRQDMDKKRFGEAVFIILLAVGAACLLVELTGQGKFLVVLSGSMSPAVNTGDLIFISRTEPNLVKSGDIIAFSKDGGIVTHRVVDVTENDGNVMFKTKGDANEDPDLMAIASPTLVGKYVFGIPFVGRFVTFVRTLPGLIALIIVPGCLVIAAEARKIFRLTLKPVRQQEVQRGT